MLLEAAQTTCQPEPATAAEVMERVLAQRERRDREWADAKRARRAAQQAADREAKKAKPVLGTDAFGPFVPELRETQHYLRSLPTFAEWKALRGGPVIEESRIGESRQKKQSFPGEYTGHTCERITRAVSAATGVSVVDMKSHRRTRDIVLPRHVAMYICKRRTLKSLPEIGKRFGNKDHTTVLNAIRRVQGLLDEGDPTVSEWVSEVEQALGVAS